MTRRTVALHYDGQTAPRVTAKAEDAVAEEMLHLAQRHGVPIHRDADLSALLSRIPLDGQIPLTLYVVVAEIIAYTYRLRAGTIPGDHADAE